MNLYSDMGDNCELTIQKNGLNFFFLYVSENFEYELKIVYFIIYIFIIHIILINIHIIKYSKIMILNLEHLDKNKDKRLEG